MFGSIDANRGDYQNGWDTDQFPNSVDELSLAVYEILRGGGFTTGGFNFDTKLRRQSMDRTDLFHAHIGGIDTLARALLVAAGMVERGAIERLREERYAGWAGDLGTSILAGTASLDALEERVAAGEIDPRPVSGRQELLENLVNQDDLGRGPAGSGRAATLTPVACVLGIDVSTTATKAVLIDESGRRAGRRRPPSTASRCRARCGASRIPACGGMAPWRRSGSVLAAAGVSGGRHRLHRPDRSDARRGPAGRGGRRPAPGDPVERPAHGRRMRRDPRRWSVPSGSSRSPATTP